MEALELAFLEIDSESNTKTSSCPTLIKDFEELQTDIEPIYENMDDIFIDNKHEPCIEREKNKLILEVQENPGENIPKNFVFKIKSNMEDANTESHYQVPKSEPYYEVPKTKPVPLYENVEMFGAASLNVENKKLQPPKEKPPPPPIMSSFDSDEETEGATVEVKDVLKRFDSIKRIKNDIRNKRSSFLGLENGDTENFLEINVAPPPDMALFLEEERRLERQLLLNAKTGFSDCSDTGMI